MNSRPRDLVAAMIAAGSMACLQGDGFSAAPESHVRDSAGIQIVENTRPPDRLRLLRRIGPRPTVSMRIRSGHSPTRPFFALDATRLRDGRIVVAHREAGMLVYEPSGLPAGSWGGSFGWSGYIGRPEVVVAVRGLARWPGDSIISWGGLGESGSGVSVYDTQGNYGRTFTYDEARIVPEHVTRDGLIVASNAMDYADTMMVQIWDAEGGLRSSLGTHPNFELYTVDEGTGQEALVRKIFGRRSVRTLWGDLVVIGTTSRYELRAFGLDGSLVRIVRLDHRPRAPSPRDIRAHIEAEVAANAYSREFREEDLLRQLQATPVAEHLPAFARVMSDAADHLWVREYEVPGKRRSAPIWTVFDPAGKVLGFVEAPAGLHIFEIGEDYVLGRTLDELDDERDAVAPYERGPPADLHVEHVQLWPLERFR